MTSPAAHFIGGIRALFSRRADVFVLKYKIQTAVFEE